MYEKFFGLRKPPFGMSPDPDVLYLTAAHREASAGLTYAIRRRKGFIVLAGHAGTGKTTLLRNLMNRIPAAEAQTCLVLNPIVSASEFLELLLMSLGVKDFPDSKARRLEILNEIIQDAHDQHRTTVAIIDEAHKLSPVVLEEIRLLTNFETAEEKLLQIVLAGQPELNSILNRPELWQLKQRVAVRLQITPLSREELRHYLEFRWAQAGAITPLPFSEDAISTLSLWSSGIPRVVNAICDNALVNALAKNSRVVERVQVEEAVGDLDIQLREWQARAEVADLPGTTRPGSDEALARTRPQPVPKMEGTVGMTVLDRYVIQSERPFWSRLMRRRLG